MNHSLIARGFRADATELRAEAARIEVGHAGTATIAEKARASVARGKAQGLEMAADKIDAVVPTVTVVNLVQMSYDLNDYRVNVGIHDVDMAVAAGFNNRHDAENYAVALSRAFSISQGASVPIKREDSNGGPIQ